MSEVGLEPGQRAPRIQSSIRLLDLTEPFLPLLLSELPPLSSSDVDILELPEPQDGSGCVDRWPAGRPALEHGPRQPGKGGSPGACFASASLRPLALSGLLYPLIQGCWTQGPLWLSE